MSNSKQPNKVQGHIYIQPRDSGKTTDLVQELKCNRGSTLLVVMNSKCLYYIKRNMFSDLSPKIIDNEYMMAFAPNNLDVSRIAELLPYREITKLLVDDYLFFNYHQKTFIQGIIQFLPNLKNVVVKTTADRIYNEDVIRIGRLVNKENISLQLFNDEFRESILDVGNSLLLDPRFQIHQWREYMKNHLPASQYKTQCLGELYD